MADIGRPGFEGSHFLQKITCDSRSRREHLRNGDSRDSQQEDCPACGTIDGDSGETSKKYVGRHGVKRDSGKDVTKHNNSRSKGGDRAHAKRSQQTPERRGDGRSQKKTMSPFARKRAGTRNRDQKGQAPLENQRSVEFASGVGWSLSRIHGPTTSWTTEDEDQKKEKKVQKGKEKEPTALWQGGGGRRKAQQEGLGERNARLKHSINAENKYKPGLRFVRAKK